jgi:hypothetical protein
MRLDQYSCNCVDSKKHELHQKPIEVDIAGAQISRRFKKACVREIEEKVKVRQIIISFPQFDTHVLLAEATTRGKTYQ